jgi:hypothetical protein
MVIDKQLVNGLSKKILCISSTLSRGISLQKTNATFITLRLLVEVAILSRVNMFECYLWNLGNGIYIMIIPITWQLRLYYLKIIIIIIIIITIIIIIINENNDRPYFANQINTNHYPGFINNIQTYLHEKVLQLIWRNASLCYDKAW